MKSLCIAVIVRFRARLAAVRRPLVRPDDQSAAIDRARRG